MPAPKTISIDGVEFIRLSDVPDTTPAKVGPDVIVRCRDAGVHIGELVSRTGREVTLKNARRLRSWQGALSLNEVASKGVTRRGSVITKPVQEILLLEASEVIPVYAGVDLSTTEK